MIFRFGECELDEARSELRRGGQAVTLQPKPLALLGLLIENRHRVVAKEEILDALWPDVAVTESSLTRAVSLARRAIGDRGERARIRSYARKGYRFVGHVAELDDARAGPGPAPALGLTPGPPPPATGMPGDDPFVGRGDALARLLDGWQQVGAGRGRVLLVQGEAGIGKSRLMDTFADQLAAEGERVLHARSDESGGAPVFWLWAQVLRALAECTDLRRVAEEIGPAAFEVAALVPALGPAPDPVPPATPPEQGRFLFFDAVTRILARCAKQRPLAILLEDLHLATRESLLLLEHLAPLIRDEPVLVVATIRETARERGHPLSRALSQLGRLDHVDTVALEGFQEAEVQAMLHGRIGHPPPGRLVTELLGHTEGNPLFLREAIRLLADRGQLHFPEAAPRFDFSDLPTRILDVVRSSLDALGDDCARALEVASVLGREFSVPVLALVEDLPRATILDALDEAVLAGTVEELDDTPGGFRFAHSLFREVTYGSLPPGRRARLHLRAAAVLEEQQGAGVGHLSEIAHHHHLSLSVGDPRRAHEVALGAARRALELVAYEQAARHFEQALAALEALASEPKARFELLVELGRAHGLAGDRTRRRAVLRTALGLARERADGEAFARAAIAFCDLAEWGATDREAAAVVDEALERLPSDEGWVRARLLARRAYLLRAERRAAEPVAREAVAEARRHDHALALQEALYPLHFALAGPDDLAERVRLVDEIVELAPATGQRDLPVIGLLDCASDRLCEGDLEGALRARREAGALAGDSPPRAIAWACAVFDAGLALLQGHLGEAEGRIRDAYALGRLIEHPYANLCFAGQTLILVRERGGQDAVSRRLVGTDIGDARRGFFTRCVPASEHLLAGREPEARRAYERLVDDVLPAEPKAPDWLCALGELAFVCTELRDGGRAPVLEELLAPYAGLHAVTPVLVTYTGPVARHLGRLAALRGELSRAQAQLEAAHASSLALGARPALARVKLDLGGILLRRGSQRPGREMLREAHELAEELGMTTLERAARSTFGPS